MWNRPNNVGRDAYFLRRALKLASQGQGQVAPNPLVGAVVVNNSYVVGEGFHRFEYVTHAEVLALDQAGPLARGGAIYVNLEPCCHSGEGKRTSPCVQALIDAKVSRVICCTEDPNPKVAGKGFKDLRAAGIEVTFGLDADAARRLNADYFASMTIRDPRRLEVTKRDSLYSAKFFVPGLKREIEVSVPRSRVLF